MAMKQLNDTFLCFEDFLKILISTALIASAVKLFINKRRFLELGLKLPGPPAYPIIGNALKFACKPDELLDRVVDILESYGNVTPIRLWMGPELYIAITEPHDIEIILNSQQATNKGYPYKFFYPFIGEGLISGSGKTWKIHRKLMTHIINQRILDAFIESFDSHGKKLVDKLEHLATGNTFDVFSFIEDCTIDMVCETVMGCSDTITLDNLNNEFKHNTAQMYKVVHERMMKIWLHPDWIYRMTSNYKDQQRAKTIINNFTERCIEDRKKELQAGEDGNSILHKLLQANDKKKELSDEELRDEIYTIYLASQDTMALILSFAVLMMGSHKDVQDKVRAEIDMVIGDDEINLENLSRLKYLEMVIKETLRLYPIAPLLIRRLDGELKLDKCVLPKNCQVVIAAYWTHRSPKFWDKPNEFIPERFDAEEISKRHPYVFIPFSAGPMGCIGKKYAIMALKTILTKIIQKFVIGSTVTPKDVKLRTDISIRSVNGYEISLELL